MPTTSCATSAASCSPPWARPPGSRTKASSMPLPPSGGGPAYVFLLIECLAKAGVEAGLPEDLAMQCARVTVAGAGELVHIASEPASRPRENVTSPAGTTLEALKNLMADEGLQHLMTRPIAAAPTPSREPGGHPTFAFTPPGPT